MSGYKISFTVLWGKVFQPLRKDSVCVCMCVFHFWAMTLNPRQFQAFSPNSNLWPQSDALPFSGQSPLATVLVASLRESCRAHLNVGGNQPQVPTFVVPGTMPGALCTQFFTDLSCLLLLVAGSHLYSWGSSHRTWAERLFKNKLIQQNISFKLNKVFTHLYLLQKYKSTI